MTRVRRRICAVITIFVGMIAWPLAASATTIGVDGGTLIFTAGASEAGSDVIVVFTSGTVLTVTGYPSVDVQTPLCTDVGGAVECSLGSFTLAAFMAGSGDDVIDASGVFGLDVFLSGGDGDDILLGGSGNDILKGGTGDDVLLGGPGLDLLFGGAGGNILLDGVAGDGDGPADPTLVSTTVPEPGTLLLTALGLSAAISRRRARQVSR